MTSTLRGAAGPGGATLATAICRSTLRRQPSGWAFTQIKPRDRRLTICVVMGVETNRKSSAAENLPDPGGQIEIVERQASGAVRGEIDHDLVPGVRPVGVVIHLLSGQRHAGHKTKRLREVAKLESAMQIVALDGP